MEATRARLLLKVVRIQETLRAHLEDANYEPAEWLGYLAADIAVLVFEPAVKFGVETAKKIALEVVEKYGDDVAIRGLNRLAFASELAAAKTAALRELPEAFSQHELAAASERMLMKAADKGGVGYIVRRGLRIPTDLAGQLKGKWYKATFKDEAESFAVHYQKHVLDELPKAGQPTVSMEKYFEDATNYYISYNGPKKFDLLKDGTPGVKLKLPNGWGGWFTAAGHPAGEGLPVSFFYR